MALQEYNRKRKFTATPEPRGAAPKVRKQKTLSFVVQLHHARARHYDFRLEVDGVLRSWAVPKGPSLRPGEKRLAVEVEDHPLSYGAFQGLIPQDHYGAGHVAIFDEGTWEPDGDPADALARGKLELELHGQRLKGRWTLVRTGKPASKPQWLLLKRSDEYAADREADDLLADIPAPPADAPGASTAKGRRILAAKAAGGGEVAKAARGTAATAAAVTKATTVTKATKATKAAPASKPAGKPAAASSPVKKPPAATAHHGARAGTDLAALHATVRALAGGRKAGGAEFLPPMLATAANAAPAGEQWLHEWKWDGYRLLAHSGPTPRLWSRNGLPWAQRVPELVRALAELGVTALLDGELIAVDARGYSDFNALQRALAGGDTAQLRYAVFDLLRLDGIDLTQAPLSERKPLLERVLQGADPRLFYSGHVTGHGPEVFEAARTQGMEGIISKRADSTYRSGRSDQWRKIKVVETRDFLIVGYTRPKGSREGVGALLLAREQAGQLVYAGRVGSGLSDALLRDLPRQLRSLESATPTAALPAHTRLPAGEVQWVRPVLVAEVVFRGWGKEGLLRQASFHRLRADKPASDAPGGGLEREHASKPEREPASKPACEPASKHASKPARKPSKQSPKQSPKQTRESVRKPARKPARKPTGKSMPPEPLPTPSSPGRVVYPDAGYTKQQVFDYYLAAADRILDDIGGRLLSVVRCPDGIGGAHFFQKHAGPGFGASVRRHTIAENDGDEAAYFFIDDVAGLMNLVQMNALEFHPWGSRVDALEQPDRMVFDLDPDTSIAWSDIKAAARDVRARLAQVGLDSYPRLSGGKGVHVVVPIQPQADWAQVRHFCEAFADAMAQHNPARYVATMSKAKRAGRIFIDWLRNGRGATAIASWSLRARPGAPAAMPLTWEQFARVSRPDRYTLQDAAQRELPAFVTTMIAKAPTLPT